MLDETSIENIKILEEKKVTRVFYIEKGSICGENMPCARYGILYGIPYCIPYNIPYHVYMVYHNIPYEIPYGVTQIGSTYTWYAV